MTDQPLRVIQWTTGNIGRRSLHAIIGRDDMELVGVYAHGADKVGVDAAELSGWPEPTGVTATNDIDALIALKPDACCYNPLWPNIDELARLLEAGINVCSSAAWITGGKQSPEDLERIRKACEKGNSTIFGSGAHPGMTNMVGMVLSAASCERVDEIRITESVDCSTYESAGTQTAMGFSQDPDTPGLAENVRRESEVFAESAAMMADAIGAKLDRMTFDVTFTPATGDTDLGFMQIPKDTVAGVYGYHRGWVGEKNVVSVGFNWTMGDHVTPPKPLEHGHVIQVFGLPNMRTVLHCLPPKDWTEPGFMGLGMIYTALPVTNAVPAVVAARPGIVTLKDLPPVTGRCAGCSGLRYVAPVWLCPDRPGRLARRGGPPSPSTTPRRDPAPPAPCRGPREVGGDESHTARPPGAPQRRCHARNPGPCAAARQGWSADAERPADVLLVDHAVGECDPASESRCQTAWFERTGADQRDEFLR